MERDIILHLSDRANGSNSVLAALQETGCEIVTTNCPTEGVALLYIMHSVAAVVLESQVREQASFDVAHSLRSIRPNIPIMLLCGDGIDSSPSWRNECVSTDKLTSALLHLLNEPVF